jgi:Putative transposase
VVQFGEWLCGEVLKAVPHRHFTFSLPKILRRYFLYDRRLLRELSPCVWESLKAFLGVVIPDVDATPGSVIAIQTFGDFLNFNPHCHVLCTDGSFFESRAFKVAHAWDSEGLEKLFQHKVLAMLRRKDKITEEMVELILSRGHSGFNVHCGVRIQPGAQEAMENIARYVLRASFSQERMTYVPGGAKVIYRSKDGKSENIFDAIERLAAMCSHVPNKGEQMVRYYGYYSNVCRGQRKKTDTDGLVPSILQIDASSKGYLKNWARIIQKIYEVDPLTCPNCSGKMKIISVIEDQDVIKKILKHLGLWQVKPPARGAYALEGGEV